MLQLTPYYNLPGLPYINILYNGFPESLSNARSVSNSPPGMVCSLSLALSLYLRLRTRPALSDLKTAGLLRAFTQRNVGLQSKGDTATDLDKDYRCYSGFTAMQNKKMQED